MNRTYKATGINLKCMPLGEADRLLTILTREFGLCQVVAPGSRKPKSKLGGRCGLFVVNELVIYQGRSLHRITQAETLASYPGLSKDLGKLAAAQYLAELVLCQALSEQPQEDLYCLFIEHLSRIERVPLEFREGLSASIPPQPSAVPLLPLLTHGIYHLLALGGIAPQIHTCCVTGRSLEPDFSHPHWRVGFSFFAGGVVSLFDFNSSQNSGHNYPHHSKSKHPNLPVLNTRLNAGELAMLQHLASPELPSLKFLWSNLPLQPFNELSLDAIWISLERLLRGYAQYHLGQIIQSATLIDTYFKLNLNPEIPAIGNRLFPKNNYPKQQSVF